MYLLPYNTNTPTACINKTARTTIIIIIIIIIYTVISGIGSFAFILIPKRVTVYLSISSTGDLAVFYQLICSRTRMRFLVFCPFPLVLYAVAIDCKIAINAKKTQGKI